MPLTFSPQSVDGTQHCLNLSVVADDLVEVHDENFTVVLALSVPDESIRITTDVTVVTIISADGMQTIHQKALC